MRHAAQAVYFFSYAEYAEETEDHRFFELDDIVFRNDECDVISAVLEHSGDEKRIECPAASTQHPRILYVPLDGVANFIRR